MKTPCSAHSGCLQWIMCRQSSRQIDMDPPVKCGEPEGDVGFKISWVGFDSIGKARALEMVGLRDTGELEVVPEAPFSGAEIPGGWFIVFSNDFGFVSRERLAQLSLDCRIIASQVHEGIMFSAAYGYERGHRVWELAHFAQQGLYDLSVSGSPPPSFESIRRRLTQRQKATAGTGVDYIFDIPVEVAAAICGYRYGRLKFAWGIPEFTRLEVR
jgi:hypothetical protein